MSHECLDRDPFVDLFNRRYVLDEVERHVRRYRRHRRPFSLLIVGIHNLAWVDDTYGQAVADRALGDLADLISANIREVDVWFLCTRDHFIVVMDETDARAVRTVVKRLAAVVESSRPNLGPDGVILDMSFSTASCPDDAEGAEALLRAAGFLSEKTRHPQRESWVS
jgi:diguanylate cyclase (GGDEF)-like protein